MWRRRRTENGVTIAQMFVYEGEVSHEWRRRHALRELNAGRMRIAAEHHGTASPRPCPICGAELREITWVYSEKLGRRTGTARSAEEIDRMVHEVGPITVHFVEVCRDCKWNHLLKEVTAVPVV